jgi:hypothetical protein
MLSDYSTKRQSAPDCGADSGCFESNTAADFPSAAAARLQSFPREMLLQIDRPCFDATHKKSLDLIFEGRKIRFVALHNLLFGLKRGLPVSYRR